MKSSLRFGILFSLLLASAAGNILRAQTAYESARHSRRIAFRLNEPVSFRGELNPYLTFRLIDPNVQTGWPTRIRADLHMDNNGSEPMYVSVAVALFDAAGKLVASGMSPVRKELDVQPGYGLTHRLEIGLAGATPEQVATAEVSYVESAIPLLNTALAEVEQKEKIEPPPKAPAPRIALPKATPLPHSTASHPHVTPSRTVAARLGSHRDELVRRYGQPFDSQRDHLGLSLVFKEDDITITTWLTDGHTVSAVSYKSPAEFTSDQMEELLQRNRLGGEWEIASVPPGFDRAWINPNGSTARYSQRWRLYTLMFRDPLLTQYQEIRDNAKVCALPCNLLSPEREELAGLCTLVDKALASYMETHGFSVKPFTPQPGTPPAETSTGATNSPALTNAAPVEATTEEVELDILEWVESASSNSPSFTGLVAPSLKYRDIQLDRPYKEGEWDGVQRRVQGASRNRRVTRMAVCTIEVSVRSLRTGEEVFRGDGGLDFVQKIEATGDKYKVVSKDLSDFNLQDFMEGISVALDPFIPRPRKEGLW